MPSARLRSRPSANVVIRSESAAGASSAPPSPCSARKATSEPADQAKPLSRELAEKSARPATNMRRLPSRSARRPPSSSVPPKRMAYAVITHWSPVAEKPRSDLIDGQGDVHDCHVENDHELSGDDESECAPAPPR